MANAENPLDGLNVRQRRFVEIHIEYPSTEPWRVAQLAGYKGKKQTLYVTSHRLFNNDKIRSAIEIIKKREANRRRSLRDKILRLAHKAAETAESRELRSDEQKFLEMGAKIEGLFIERHDHRVEVHPPTLPPGRREELKHIIVRHADAPAALPPGADAGEELPSRSQDERSEVETTEEASEEERAS